MSKTAFTLTLEAPPDETDPGSIRRLRALLKTAGRRLRLKCIACRASTEATTDCQAAPGDGDARLHGATELTAWATYRLGELLTKMPKAKGVRMAGKSKFGGSIVEPPNDTPTLAELGIENTQASRAQKLAPLSVPGAGPQRQGDLFPEATDNSTAARLARLLALPGVKRASDLEAAGARGAGLSGNQTASPRDRGKTGPGRKNR